MAWQDIALSLANGILILPLIPTVLDKNAQIPRTTSIPTGACILTIGLVYATLGLWYATATAVTQSFLWAYIALYRPVTS